MNVFDWCLLAVPAHFDTADPPKPIGYRLSNADDHEITPRRPRQMRTGHLRNVQWPLLVASTRGGLIAESHRSAARR